MFTLLDVPVAGAYHLVMTLAGAIPPALTIVLFTVAVRLLLHPLTRAAVRGEQARAALAPDVRKLQRRYGKDRERLAREISALYRKSGTSMFAGCLPMLLQIPFFLVMFRLFSAETIGGAHNALLDHTLFGSPLGLRWLSAPGDPVFLGLFAALAVAAWCSARLIRRTGAEVPSPLRLLPYGSVLGATVIPLAAGVYLLATTAFATAERAYLRRGV